MASVSECGIVGEWTKSIINHLYRCAASVYDDDDHDDDDDDVGDDISDDDSDNDNGNRIVKHWESLMDYLCNVHDNCYHIELSNLEQRKRKWLIATTYSKIYYIILDLI